MKKTLYGTTALATAGLLMAGAGSAEAAEGIKLGIGGYMNNFFGVGDVSTDTLDGRDFNNTGLFSDGEVWFTGETTLDNGLTFGANIQLESFTSGDQIDENFAYIEGSFGRVLLGSENSAAYLMQYSAPNVGVPVNSGWVTVFVAPPPGQAAAFRNPSLSTFNDYGNDENQITYFTPRFSGFQLGVSYAPSVVGTGDGKNFPAAADKDTEFHNGFSIGANFVESFNGIDVAVAGGYRTASAPAGVPDDLEIISTGINLGYAGFTVGGSFSTRTDAGAQHGHAFDLGASYATGPWSFGVTYIQSEVEGIVPVSAKDEMHALNGGVAYKVGPGITASASLLYVEWEEELGLENDGVVGVVGLKFNF